MPKETDGPNSLNSLEKDPWFARPGNHERVREIQLPAGDDLARVVRVRPIVVTEPETGRQTTIFKLPKNRTK